MDNYMVTSGKLDYYVTMGSLTGTIGFGAVAYGADILHKKLSVNFNTSGNDVHKLACLSKIRSGSSVVGLVSFASLIIWRISDPSKIIANWWNNEKPRAD